MTSIQGRSSRVDGISDGKGAPPPMVTRYSFKYTCTRKRLGSSLNSRQIELTCIVKKNISPPLASGQLHGSG
jgi:hypothetical protein